MRAGMYSELALVKRCGRETFADLNRRTMYRFVTLMYGFNDGMLFGKGCASYNELWLNA